MTSSTSMKVIENMPVFLAGKEWLVEMATVGYRTLTKLPAWQTTEARIQNAVRNKHRALNQAASNGQWRDFDAIELTDVEEDLYHTLRQQVMDQEAKLLEQAASTAESRTEEQKEHLQMLAARAKAAMRCEECAGAEDQHPVDLRPKWERHKYSQVCQMFTWGGECPHQAGGKVCNYAHSVEQLRQGVASCQFGAGCSCVLFVSLESTACL